MSLRGLHARALQAREAHPLEVPGRAQAAEHGARQEAVEALAEARAGGVLGRRDAHVVAAVVLDEEVAVAALGERDTAEPALEARALVAELVRGVDRDAADHRDGQREPDAVEHARGSPLDHSQQAKIEPAVLDRQVGVGAPAVVAVLFEPLDHAVGRVARVHADDQVEQREDREDEERAVEPEDAEPGQLDEPPGDEREGGHEQPEQPRVALGVAPGGLRRVRGGAGLGWGGACFGGGWRG